MNKTIVVLGVFFGMTAVILGAFATHGLEKVVAKEAIATFETGARYQMYHAFLLLFIGIWDGLSLKRRLFLMRLIVVGTLLFSGSIYLLATNSLTSFDFKKIALLTPLGGTLLIVAWGLFGYSVVVKK